MRPSALRRVAPLAASPIPGPGSRLVLALPVGWLVVAYLGSLPVPVRQRVLERRLVHVAADRHQLTLDNSVELLTDRRLPDRHVANRPDGGARDAATASCSRSPSRTTWPGSRRRASAPVLAVSIVMPLWSSYLDQGLCVAPDPRRERRPQLAAGAVRAARARATATWPSGSSTSYLWLPYMILPIYAGLERIPSRCSRRPPTSADVAGSRSAGSSCRCRSRRSPPGSIFTFSLTLGDYIVPELVSNTQFIGNVIYINVGRRTSRSRPPTRSCPRDHDADLPAHRRAGSAPSRPSDGPTGFGTRLSLRVATGPAPRVHLLPAAARRRLRLQRKWDHAGRRPGSPSSGSALALENTGLQQAIHDLDRQPPSGRRSSRWPWAALTALAVSALRLLRTRDDLVRRHPSARAAWHRDRHGADRRPSHSFGIAARDARRHHRPRDLLHRARVLQQRHRAPAADVTLASRRRRRTSAPTPSDVPVRDRSRPSRTALIAGALLAFALVVRRDHRHDLHVERGHADPADLDLQQLPALRTSSRS